MPSRFSYKEITQNLELLFNPSNKQIRLEEAVEDVAFKSYFNQDLDVNVIIPNKKSSKAKVVYNNKNNTFSIFSEALPDEIKQGEVVIMMFMKEGDTLIAQTEAISFKSSFNRNFINKSVVVKALDPRRFKRVDIKKRIRIYTIAKEAEDQIQHGELKLTRKYLNRKTSHNAEPNICQDFFCNEEDQDVFPIEYHADEVEEIAGSTLDVSLGGIGMNVENEFLEKLELNKMIYTEMDLHLRGVMRKVGTFAVVRHTKGNPEGKAFVAIMFVESLPENLFK